jgi:uncharacterized protein (DUF1330 family)
MTIYLIAEFTVHDPIKFAQYRTVLRERVEKNGGRFLVADGAPVRLIGEQTGLDRVGLLAFDRIEDLRALRDGSDGLQLSVLREAGADCKLTLVQGLDPDAMRPTDRPDNVIVTPTREVFAKFARAASEHSPQAEDIETQDISREKASGTAGAYPPDRPA